MKRIVSLLLVMASLMFASLFVQAQNPEVIVTPNTIGIDDTITITASGLEANTTYIIDVLFEEASVFATERTSNNRGQLVISLRSEPSDPFGEYAVIVVLDGFEVARTTFMLEDTSPPDPIETDASLTASVIVSPDSATVGNTHNILISGLEAGQAITLQIRDAEDSLKYSRRLVADNNGRVQVRIFTEENEDEPGVYSVNVLNSDNTVIGATVLILEDFIGRDGILTISPDVIEAGTTVTLRAVEVKPFADLTILILREQTNERIFMTRQRADVDGTIHLNHTLDDDLAPGDYRVEVREGEIVVASGGFTLGDASDHDASQQDDDHDATDEDEADEDEADEAEADETSEAEEEDVPIRPASISIAPDSGVRGTVHTMIIEDLDAGETVSFQIQLGEAILFETERTADADGTFRIDIQSDPNDAFGVYRALVLRDERVIAEASFTIMRDTSPADTSPPTPPVTQEEVSATSMIYRGELTFDSPESRYTFEGQAGDFINISLESMDFDAYLKLFDSQGNLVAEDDDGGEGLNSLIGAFIVPSDDTYTILVSSYSYTWSEDVSTGAYTLTISKGELQDIGFDEVRVVSFDEDVTAQFFALDLRVGEVLRVTVVGDGVFDTTLRLNDPDNFEVYYDDDGGRGYDPEIYRYVVRHSGKHVLTLATYTPGTVGSVELLVERRDVLRLEEGAQTIQLTSKINQEVLTYSGGTAGEAQHLHIEQLDGHVRELYVMVYQGDTFLMAYSVDHGIPSSMTLGYVLVSDEDVTITIETFTSSATLGVEVQPNR